MDDLEIAQMKADIGEEILIFVQTSLARRGNPDAPNPLECILTAAWLAAKEEAGASAHDWFARWLRSFADRVDQLAGKPN